MSKVFSGVCLVLGLLGGGAEAADMTGCSKEDAVAVYLDASSAPTPKDQQTAASVETYLRTALAPGRAVRIFLDDGSGVPALQFPKDGAAACRPAVCSSDHPLIQLMRGGLTRCTQAAVGAADKAFGEAVSDAFGAYREAPGGTRSRTFDGIASVARAMRSAGYASGSLVVVSDGVPHDPPTYSYHRDAPWVVEERSRSAFFQTLRVRDALPDLVLWRVNIVGFGAAFSDKAKAAGETVSVDEHAALRELWLGYCGEAGCRLAFGYHFDPSILEE